MVQGEDIQITSDTPNGRNVQNSSHFKGPKAQTSPTFQQLLQSDGSKWSHIASQIKKKNHDQEDDGNRHNKKSVLAKVKETAKKLKISLRRKKHSEKNESPCDLAPPSSGVGPKDKGEEEEDAEHHCAQSNNKQSLVSTSGKHLEKLNAKQSKDEDAPSDPSVDAADTDDTKNQTSTTIDVPKAHEFPQRNSRFSGLSVSTSETSENKSDKSLKEEENAKGESKTIDKGVSMKEYLMHKFEPGEDERALSKVITQTISPRRYKMREDMNSFLKNEESCEVNSTNADNNVNHNLKSKSLPTPSTNTNNIGSNIAPIKQSYSVGSNASKASMNLNQTFKSTFASYQDHFLSSSSNASSPSSHASSGNETRVPSHTATSVRRVPVSRAKQTQVPSLTETNSFQVRPSARTGGNAVRASLSTGDQDRLKV
ncbi:hypothetical protein HanRHA438_Chr05g0208071 [Helianthus annuus]|uniref:LTI65/LTI78 PGEED repeat domain-containing protein n=1 Tax=Helianthus annuus TaxID=4232 RepID=A0A251ULU2_HELAN|nr:hypothetical protein HanXRQr2_Chr05g0198491 [Helianthus annuus]KAJ0917622.1 hypothetical protein HanRHA438_Chr05g0208071 [Helianthus annuus]KAJ0921436.1 hypothetical protein HanPSC8_Chr05g0191481 [Helianthus annuus]